MDYRDCIDAYYESIDDATYDRLDEVLTAEFVQYRSDRTLEGRDTFVSFMRDDRPVTDTRHHVDAVYGDGSEAAVRGRLHDADGETLFEFVDVFEFEDDRVAALYTYTR